MVQKKNSKTKYVNKKGKPEINIKAKISLYFLQLHLKD